MDKIHVTFDLQTGEETVVTLPETNEEKLAREATEALAAEMLSQQEAKNAIAAKLGLTVDELKTLLS